MRINEIYLSLQGESTYSGLPCVMIRTTGCNLRCSYCDSAFSFTEARDMSLPEILKAVDAFHVPLVELTGGEPLLQTESLELLKTLCDRNYTVLLETSGSLDISKIDPRVIIVMDLKCPSSGEMESMLWENINALRSKDEVKFVVGDERDFYWALNVVRKHRLDTKCTVLYSCVFETLQPSLLAEWILKERAPGRMQLQQHKYIWDPLKRKV